MFFVIPEMPSKTFVMVLKKLPDHFNAIALLYAAHSSAAVVADFEILWFGKNQYQNFKINIIKRYLVDKKTAQNKEIDKKIPPPHQTKKLLRSILPQYY